MRRSATAAVAAAVAAGGAAAQDGWGVTPISTGTGAEVCAAFPQEGGGGACRAVGCGGAEPLAIHLLVQGAAMPESFLAAVAVDGRAGTTLAFEPARREDARRAVVAPDAAALIDELKAGARAVVSLADGSFRQEFTLRGSADAIDAALAACPTAG